MGQIIPTTFGDDDIKRMKEIERAVVQALLPFMANTSPLLGLYVLIRCARTLMRKMPNEITRSILPVLFAFLEGRTERPDGPHRLLWTPKRGN